MFQCLANIRIAVCFAAVFFTFAVSSGSAFGQSMPAASAGVFVSKGVTTTQINTSASTVATPPAVSSVPTDRFIQDEAGLIKENVRDQILAASKEIEDSLKIRILIRTEFIEDMAFYSNRVETFFSDWIRSIGLEKRGVLLFAGLPHNSLKGKFNLRVGIGLKYLITREMGERIVNHIILPANAENSDGKGFLEGILAVKRMLIDEYKSEQNRNIIPSGAFDLSDFLWRSKEVLLAILVAVFFSYLVFFVERCPRCNGNLRISYETLKEPGQNTLGLRRKVYFCERCAFSRRKKEPIYPAGKFGIWLRLTGSRRNVKIASFPHSDEASPSQPSSKENNDGRPPSA
ncbi:MAG: TPM domain-containing protein [Candidatus Riflebacteria bacterium]|nr:TPM domain-containing protein [Candidatus Riflebacteria bacterium]